MSNEIWSVDTFGAEYNSVHSSKLACSLVYDSHANKKWR